ncbi:MAG TPA: WYL domain-containing protein [Dehalococcoidia bacterium]|nr:WYL domain-containing protein [Dehalococcoidia bacterium]
MKLDEVVKRITEAIQKKRVVEVTYIRGEDGVRTCRMMEPFDVAIGRRHKTGRKMFWGWCREHNELESKIPANIISIEITDETFNPKIREKTFGSPARYEIKRDWK